jgi:hypothetical protein
MTELVLRGTSIATVDQILCVKQNLHSQLRSVKIPCPVEKGGGCSELHIAVASTIFSETGLEEDPKTLNLKLRLQEFIMVNLEDLSAQEL